MREENNMFCDYNFEGAFYKLEEGKIYKDIVNQVERPLIEWALKRVCGNQIRAAKLLGINRNTIRTKIRKLGINVERWKSEP